MFTSGCIFENLSIAKSTSILDANNGADMASQQ
jgi:hypothetical protein